MPKTAKKKLTKSDLLKKVRLVVDEKIRPILQADGGDMEIIKLHDDGILDIQLVGACQGCPSAAMTLTFGVQQILDEALPEDDIQINPI